MAQNLFAYFDNSPYHKPRIVHSSLKKLGITETKYITSHFPFFMLVPGPLKTHVDSWSDYTAVCKFMPSI